MSNLKEYLNTQLNRSRQHLAKAEASLEMLEDAFCSMHFITDKNIDFIEEVDRLKFKFEVIKEKIEDFLQD